MPDLHQLLLFVAAGWLLNLTPGPDVLYIVSHSLRKGARAGLVAGLGITAGCCVHMTAAALGVGSLIAASATVFTVVKWIGAAYLVWMGIRSLASWASSPRAAIADDAAAADTAESLRVVFRRGFWTNLLNPKVVIFFVAFIPQFIAHDARDKALAFFALGTLFVVNSVPVTVGWALAAAWLARRAAVRRGLHWLDKLAGAMFVGFGVRLALAEGPGR